MKKFVVAVVAILTATLLLHLSRSQSDRLPNPDSKAVSRRIVSLAPHLTGLTFALSRGAQLVGVTTYCDYPPEGVSGIQRIGDFLNPNLEQIVSLQPDLILAEQWSSSRTVPRLQQLGFEVREFPTPQSLAEIYGLIREVAILLEAQAEGKTLVQQMETRTRLIERKATRFDRPPRVYLEIDLPSWTVGRASFTNEAIARCGARNIFEDVPTPAPQVSEESIIERDPEVIVSFVASRDEIAGRPGWNRISAVRNRRIIDDFDQALISRGNHRIVDGMELLQDRLLEAMGEND